MGQEVCYIYIFLIFIFSVFGYGDPDISCDCSDAILSISESNAINISIGETRTFCVCGSYEWSSSGYLIYSNLNQSYSIFVLGNQYWEDYNHNTSYNGYTNKWIKLICCDNQYESMDKYMDIGLRYPLKKRWASLICCYGKIQDLTDQIDYCFSIDNSSINQIRYITNLPQLISKTTIECYANDILNMYGDNDGAINVTITRHS